jgi:hypothetical protein
VCAGTQDAMRMFTMDPSVKNRFHPEYMPVWRDNDDLRDLLHAFERLVPLKQASNLHEDSIARIILARSEGLIGEMFELLVASATLAVRTGDERITAKTVEMANYVSPEKRDLSARQLADWPS